MMSEIKKINSGETTVSNDFLKLAEKEPEKNFSAGKKIGIIIVFVLFLIFLSVFAVVLPALQIRKDVLRLEEVAKDIPQAIREQDLNLAMEKISSVKISLTDLRGSYSRLSWLKFFPLVNSYYRDGENFLNSAYYLVEAGEISGAAIEPYADLLGLKAKEGEKKNPPMTAEQRLEMALDTLDKLQPSMESLGEKLGQAKQEVDKVNPYRYPEVMLGKKVRENIVAYIVFVDNAAQMMKEIKPIAGYLKPLLGIPKEKRYLILFQNDAELRPTGGFITAYAVISVQNGNFRPLGSYDIYTLDARFGNRLPAPRPIKEFHKNVFNWHLRDMNLSPDFRVSMETFMENYGKVEDKAKIDGVVAVDTQVLVDILRVLGQIGVPGWGNFSANNDSRCDCPQVVYQLESLADRPTSSARAERKAVIGPLMHSLILNTMQSPRKKWPEFFNIFFKNVKEKHIIFYFFDENLQRAVEALNAAGRIKEFEGDYLHVNDANFAGAKSNLFIRESFTQEIEIAADGTVTKKLTIDYRNPAPPSNCNLEAGQLCLNGLYRDWVRIYVPEGSQLVESSGSEIPVNTYNELGKTVFEAFYGDKSPLRPQGKTQLTFTYRLPFKYDGRSPYRLLIQKQPGTYGYENTVIFNGQQQTFELDTDRELRL